VRGELVEIYRATFVARCEVIRGQGQPELDEDGICGLLPSTQSPLIQLLVTDDHAEGRLAALLRDARVGRINVFAEAARCAELVRSETQWNADEPTAMIFRDLRVVPGLALPPDLTLRPVRRTDDEPAGGVPLEDAVAAVRREASGTDGPPDMLASYLRSLPPSTRLFCAVDSENAVRATSGCSTFGTEASVFFVNTDPGWRRRGIARTMTATALRAALASGARRASLDSSDAGISTYRTLGFECIGRVTRFSRTRPPDDPAGSLPSTA